MSSIIIRYALKEELDAIVSLVHEVCQDADIWSGYPEEEIKEEFSYCFLDFKEDDDHYNFMTPKCVVAEYNNVIIGMMTFRQSLMCGSIFDIGWCMIKPQFQNSLLRVGYRLAIFVIDYIKSIRDNGIIQVAAINQKLLIKLGFTDSGLSVNEWGTVLHVLHLKF